MTYKEAITNVLIDGHHMTQGELYYSCQLLTDMRNTSFLDSLTELMTDDEVRMLRERIKGGTISVVVYYHLTCSL